MSWQVGVHNRNHHNVFHKVVEGKQMLGMLVVKSQDRLVVHVRGMLVGHLQDMQNGDKANMEDTLMMNMQEYGRREDTLMMNNSC